MPTSERAIDRGRRLARTDRVRVGGELRDARVATGLSLDHVGKVVGLSGSQVSRIERGLAPAATVVQLALIGATVGLDVRTRAYPGADPIRDVAQQRVIDRLVPRLHPSLRLRREVTLGIDGDLRAWDGWIDQFVATVPGAFADGLPMEAETRIADGQAFLRRLARKMRDGGAVAVLVAVADTAINRAAIDAMRLTDSASFPVSPRAALGALAEGRHPGGSSIVFL